ncbi:MAG TPA: glycosyl hydrolase family 38 [Isosphaeraceae bacterium]|jgi:alpha-mannosidase|nr:glycosyl hydrolase family 38 [Isosphaeraceae bacterium]
MESTEEPGPIRPRLVALLADAGREPAATLTDAVAAATWAVATAPWHPLVLSRLETLPSIEPVEAPSPPEPGIVRVLAAASAGRLPEEYRAQAERAGAELVEGEADRLALVARILERLGPGAEVAPDRVADPLALDFLALGTARWTLHDLTIAMGQVDPLDLDSLAREALAGARAWAEGDEATAASRLRAAFEVLTQARERFYPVDAYLVDLCLLDATSPPDALADPLAAHAPITFIAPARAIETLAGHDPEAMTRLREAITEGWVDVAGGAFDEVDEPLLPIESILWQFRAGSEVYRERLDDRNVETLARRRFGLYPQLPQLARRFGFRFGLPFGFDAGRFPVRPETKRLWGAPDGTSLEALTRPPVAADRDAEGARLAWRLGRSMKDDHVAVVPLLHWPNRVAGWYRDLRRTAAYSPVLARWVTLNDFFHQTDRPFETFHLEADELATPYLAQAVARGDGSPIARRARHARLRARFDALDALRAMADAIRVASPDGIEDVSNVEAMIETDRLDEADVALDRLTPPIAATVAGAIAGTATAGRPGFLVLNPIGVARRAPVTLPDAAPDLRHEGPLRGAQPAEEGVVGVVELLPFGFAWVPREPLRDAPAPAAAHLAARGRVVRNETIECEFDEVTGGIRGIKGVGEPSARLGQQVVATGLLGPDGQPSASLMRAEGFAVDYGGPALVQATSHGALLDPGDGRAIAKFRQRVRLWTGRPSLELEIELGDLDPSWLAIAANADPWARAIACRWAWPDTNSSLRRTCHLAPELTEADRPETPDVFDIATRRQRTAIAFGGLAHHRRHGGRMLDTSLVAGRESCRTFRFAVALDLEHPYQAAADLVAPAIVVPMNSGPPRSGPSGWIFHVDHKAVAVTAVRPLATTVEGRGPGLAFHLVETAGRAARCRLRLARDPVSARQTDFQGEPMMDLPTEGDAVLVDLTPHELARVEVTLD